MTENNGFSLDVDEAAEEFFSARKLLAPGWYDMVILNAELKNNKAGTGKVLSISFDNGLKVFLNVFNANPTAQRIGRAELAKIVQCIGMSGSFNFPGDIPKTFGRKLQADVIQEEQSDGKVFNRITNYKAPEKATNGSPKPAQTPATKDDQAPW